MSQGLGKVQRQILGAIDKRGVSTIWGLTEHIYGDSSTIAQYQTVRRAVSGLVSRGLMKSFEAWRKQMVVWTDTQRTSKRKQFGRAETVDKYFEDLYASFESD